MNIDTMPSYAGNDAATLADWVKAFQHISTVLHAAGKADGVSVQVGWNPSVLNYSHAGNVIQTVTPGISMSISSPPTSMAMSSPRLADAPL
jgi:hypothetical protein